MKELSEYYKIGEFYLRLDICSYRNVKVEQLSKLTVPFIPYTCANLGVFWCLRLVDLDPSIQENFSGEPEIRSISRDALADSSVTFNQDDQLQISLSSLDPQIFTQERMLFSVMLLATWWHVIHGGLCIHAAGISYKHKGILFLGESGAGKSTISTLCAEIGIPVLAEDKMFVINDKEKGFVLAGGPHQSTGFTDYIELRPKLAAAYILVKDKEDFIESLSEIEAAKYIFSAFLQNSASGSLSNEVFRLAFSTAIDISHDLPVYKLHFKKSTDFLTLIDAQFHE